MASSFITAVSRFPRPRPYRIFRRISTSPTSFREKKAAPCQPSHDSDKYNYNTSVSFDETPDCKHLDYPLVTANDLKTARDPPTRVKLLVRDFIEDSLYNPQYGYFSQQATIFAPADGAFNFTALRDSVEFQDEVAKRYGQYGHGSHDGPGRQLWHTPTELFKPWYGQAIARCLVSEYLLKYFPYEDFIVYEVGAGNGTLAMDVLDYIRDEYPEVYDRTQYNIIEISEKLVNIQKKKLEPAHSCVNVVRRSIFHWTTREPAPCFFVAMEVVDNFAHDLIRYDLRTLEPYQGFIAIDEHRDFHTFYSKVSDPLVSSFLGLRLKLSHPPPLSGLVRRSSIFRTFYASLPFAPNLSKPEYIPTRLLSFLHVLRDYFPRQRLLLSDFSSLPDTIPGVNAPVVQTRYRGTTVPCETLLVNQGWFDIFFPTNFERLRDMYEHTISEPRHLQEHGAAGMVDPVHPSRTSPLTTSAVSLALGENFFSSHRPHNRRSPLDGVASASGLPVGERKSNVFTHAEFLETYADLNKTRLRNGENPMVEFYRNVKFLF